MAYLAAILSILLLLIGLFYSPRLVRINNIAFGIFLGAAYFLLIPLAYWLVSGILFIPDFSQIGKLDISEFDQALWLLFIYLFELYLIFFVIKIGYKRSIKRIPSLGYLKRKQYVIYNLAIYLYFTISLFLIYSSGVLAGGHWYSTRGKYLTQTGDIAVILLFLIWGLRILIVGYTFEMLDLRVISIKKALVITLLICGFELMYVGNRIVILMFGIAGFVFIARRFGKIILFSVLLSVLPIALMMAVYQNARHLLFIVPKSEFFRTLYIMTSTVILGEEFWDVFLKIFEYADFSLLMKIFDDVGYLVPPLGGITLLKTISWFIPRSIWVSKPDSVTILIGNIYLPGTGVSLVGLLFGEMHLNFGLWGLLLFPISLIIIIFALNYIRNYIPLNFYWGLLTGFLLFRMPISDIIVSSVFVLISYYFLAQLARIFEFRKNIKFIPTKNIQTESLNKKASK